MKALFLCMGFLLSLQANANDEATYEIWAPYSVTIHRSYPASMGCLNAKPRLNALRAQSKAMMEKVREEDKASAREELVEQMEASMRQMANFVQYGLDCNCFTDPDFWRQDAATIARTRKPQLPRYCRP